MVILDLMRLMTGLPDGGTGEVAIRSGEDLVLARRWCAHSGNTIVREDVDANDIGTLVVRRGHAPDPRDALSPDRMPGARLWLYTNFHCNLACDYCCVSSSPQAPRRELGVGRITRLVAEAADWGVGEIYLTGGEPFLLPDIGEIVRTCMDTLPTTVLTNAMVFKGRGLRALESMPRQGLALQISLDSATPDLHDSHRGAGSWAKAVAGIRLARELGFRVRIAATIAAPRPGTIAQLHEFCDHLGIERDDQLIRPIARQGAAVKGLIITTESLVPEVTVTADGIYWHPVAAIDDDALVTRQIEPLRHALDEIYERFTQQWAVAATAAALFPCA
ncbi:Rv1681 family radical SAM protein [Rhodococcus marinonascens]|uniref:Rv1681 family radical SAM protein n=1 Tax=Rhodococcus marinonascens TaxID=38311 RepID=UPI0009331A43|nr:radical SAM protein [Rhodococcus marinonascens]